ncbi:MAG TPA: MlaD family protein [Opitutaceae bacterium]|nr:MlaD family protein [Opitutaceae bacterium]
MSSSPPVPKVSRAPTFPLVWVVPIIAIALGGWMVMRELKNRGPEITIEFEDGSGVAADKTVLEHKGVAVGMVTGVEMKPALDGVSVRVRLDKSAAALARDGALFWIVHPEIGLSGVRGLDTLLTGAKLNVRPGKGPPANRFVGLEKTPPPEIPEQGRTFTLQSDRLGSLTTGAGIFYREMKVGVVETSRLADDATGVLIRIHIEAPYADLVRTNTRFWNAGGFSFKVGLLGAELKNTSLESLVSGGIAFATPTGENGTLAPPAADGAVFQVAPEPDKDWLKWAPKIPLKAPEVVSVPPAKPGSGK